MPSVTIAELEILSLSELSSYREVNEYLQIGWRLLSVYNKVQPDGDQYPMYILGWPALMGLPRLPEGLEDNLSAWENFDFG